jgi:ribosomal protein S27AE
LTEEIRFCPNCGSTDVEPDSSHTNQLGEIIANPDKWICNQCDYRGLMPKGDPEEYQESPNEMDFEPRKQQKIDTDLGKGEFNFFIYFSLPLILLILLVVLAGYLL